MKDKSQMDSKELEYKELFLAEALENHEELNRLMTELEKNSSNKNAINALFRITHTLKGNASGMGFEDITKLSHTLEDLFNEIRSGKLQVDATIFNDLFKAIDTLGALINSLKTGQPVRYQGIKAKLEVIIRKATENNEVISPIAPIEQPIKTKARSGKNTLVTKATDSPSTLAPVHVQERVAPLTATTGATTATIEPGVEQKILPQESTIGNQETEKPDTEKVDAQITFSDLVQVPVKKLDNLLNLVSELTIERDRLVAMHMGKLSKNEYSRLQRISSDLQYSVMDVRLVQVGFLFNKFHRVLRDAAASENKKVSLKLEGTDTEIDRNILQIISDSLIHLIRNSVGHGIETPAERLNAGKAETGTVTLRASTDKDSVIIEIQDDGKGIDHTIIRKKAIEKGLISKEAASQLSEMDCIMYIFEPGFSSVDQVTSISGRGVGMDVVKKAIDAVGGNISLFTKVGQGTVIKLSLPSSMAVKGTLLFELDRTEYAIPLTYTEAVGCLYKKDIHKVGNGLVATHLGKTISIVFLKDLFALNDYSHHSREGVFHTSFDRVSPDEKLSIIIVSYHNRRVGLVVDKLLQQKEIIEKPLAKPVDVVKFISGVTILGNGNICLVLNITAMISYIFRISNTATQLQSLSA
ncbi:chemotaxis protein CheA [Rhodocytophaga aerolata]|uniref:Chemotaxis protein CheA n=1 Tax=Rhodocytophaga aerolata TaxID=455078 RepID=A0ABT8R7P1_9BACT|nr:chemotaxis protein CheA [Rhodocytophaga aerolata]MDO1446695.1 chemotaxis protein CheA [Rhodocytophaga aerolata]